MTQRWKITLEYDGRGFFGWQKQIGQISVQEAVETALFKLSGEKIKLTVAGRTDTGVHARGQVAHFDFEKVMTPERLRLAINALARPHPVVVTKVKAVAPDFHARFHARERSYQYRIVNRRTPLTFDKGLAWQVHHPLDVEAMYKASRCLLGKNDYTSFRAVGCQAKSAIRSIDSVEFVQHGDDLLINITARSFLYHQVRNMVGTLKKIGVGEWPWEKMQEILDAKDRTVAGMTAPSDGLYFMNVMYPDV